MCGNNAMGILKKKKPPEIQFIPLRTFLSFLEKPTFLPKLLRMLFFTEYKKRLFSSNPAMMSLPQCAHQSEFRQRENKQYAHIVSARLVGIRCYNADLCQKGTQNTQNSHHTAQTEPCFCLVCRENSICFLIDSNCAAGKFCKNSNR